MMSIRHAIAQLGLLLCILGVATADRENDNPTPILHKRVFFDTAFGVGPLEAIKDHAQNLALPNDAAIEDPVRIARSSGLFDATNCKYNRERCSRSAECCSNFCHQLFRRCVA